MWACRSQALQRPLLFSWRWLATTSGACRSAQYDGSLSDRTVELIKTFMEKPPAALATALPDGVTLLRHPPTGNKVFLLSKFGTLIHFRFTARTEALVRQVQPGLLALQSLQGYHAAKAGIVETQGVSQRPPHVAPWHWTRAKQLLQHKQELLEQQQELRGRVEAAGSPRVREALQKVLAVVEDKLKAPMMQDDIVDVNRGTMYVPRAVELSGGFERDEIVSLDGDTAEAEELKGRTKSQFPPWVTTKALRWMSGMEAFVEGSEYLAAQAAAPPNSRAVCLAPTQEEQAAFVRREKLWVVERPKSMFLRSGLTTEASNIRDEGRLEVPAALDLSLLGEDDLSEWHRLLSKAQAARLGSDVAGYDIEVKHWCRLWVWQGAYMADCLAAKAPPHNLLTVSIVQKELLPFMLQRWFQLCQDREPANHGGKLARRTQPSRGVGKRARR